MSDENRWREQRGLDADTQRPQYQPRLEADLGGELTADLGVRVERVGLATGAVQRKHQLLPRAIAIGMLRDDRPKLADHVGVLAELTRARTSVSASSSRRSSSSALGVGSQRRIGDVGERRPAPQPERLDREPARLPRFAARQCVLRRRSAPACGVRRRAHAPHRASS
jgi:hypothetical protein